MTDLLRTDTLIERLIRRDLPAVEAERKGRWFARTIRSLPPGDAEVAAFFVPGRIEVLGKHTDYAGGSSMVVAAQRGFCLAARRRVDRLVRVTDALREEAAEFELGPELVPRVGHWSNYAMTVARRMARNFPTAQCGADIALASDLPAAAGMSSSSAMIVGLFLALSSTSALGAPDDCPDLLIDRLTLAGYLATVENGQSFGSLRGDRGVGTFGGSEDHTAILCCRPGHFSQYAYCPVRFEHEMAIPAGHTFAVGVSGVVAEKTGGARQKYNEASRLASEAAGRWRQATGHDDPHLAAILSSSADAHRRLHDILAAADCSDPERSALCDRVEHFAVENQQIIPAAGEALRRGDLAAFGLEVDRSQHAAETLLGNQIPQTSYLARVARENGAVAASAFGAGFGGSVWALVETCRIEPFLAAWGDAYRREFPENAASCSFFPTGAGPAAFRVV